MVLGGRTMKKLRRELREKSGRDPVTRKKVSEYASAYARRIGVINDEVEAQRSALIAARREERRKAKEVPMHTQMTPQSIIRDGVVASQVATTSAPRKIITKTKKEAGRRGVVVTPMEGEGAGISINVHRPIDKLKERFNLRQCE